MDFRVTVIFGALVLYLSYYFYRLRKEASLARQHGCQPPVEHNSYIPFGNFFFIAKLFHDVPTQTKWHLRYGKTYSLAGTASGVIFTSAPENVKTISTGKDWGVSPMRLPSMEPFLGRGFVDTDGAEWMHGRKLLKPMFGKSNLENLSILASEVDKMLHDIPTDGSTVDLAEMLNKVFFHTSINFVLGLEYDAYSSKFDDPYDVKTFVDAFDGCVSNVQTRLTLGRLIRLLPEGKFKKDRQIVYDVLDHFIDKALGDSNAEKGKLDIDDSFQSTRQRLSLVQGLAKQTDERYLIRSQVLQAMFASEETTSMLLNNTFFYLSRSPDLWKHIREFVAAQGPELKTFDALQNCTLLRNILLEVVRLHPALPVVGRAALDDTKLPVGGGESGDSPVHLPKGSAAFASVYALHRDKSIYGDNADAFDPSRWDRINPEQWEFVPFGGGGRACLGQQKALVEAAYVLVRFAEAFKNIESRDDRPWTGVLRLTWRNKNGCKVAVSAAK